MDTTGSTLQRAGLGFIGSRGGGREGWKHPEEDLSEYRQSVKWNYQTLYCEKPHLFSMIIMILSKQDRQFILCTLTVQLLDSNIRLSFTKRSICGFLTLSCDL